MLLSEVTYAILDIIRGGYISDDEKLDIRLIETFIRSKRAQYIQEYIEPGKPLPEHFYQYCGSTSKSLLSNPTDTVKIYKLLGLPKVVFSRNGPVIMEISEANNIYKGVALDSQPFKLVNNYAFKYSGEGRFNGNWIYATYKNDTLFLKSKGTKLPTINKFSIKAVFEDPKSVTAFDCTEHDYPITIQAYEYIKEQVLATDLKIFISVKSDTENDSSGEMDNK